MKPSALTLGRIVNRGPLNTGAVLNRISKWIMVSRERGQLAELDARMLDDIGITPADAAQEAGRPFWDTITR